VTATDFNQKNIDRFHAQEGRDIAPWGDNLLLLTSKGARSGDEITTPLVHRRRGDDIVVVASKGGPDGRPLFSSAETLQGSTPVNGTQYLSTGSYHFVCTIHPGMEADLQVSTNGTPVARPQISLKILSTSIRKVANSGQLKVKVIAVTAGKGITVTAKKGSKTLTKAAKLDLDAGASQTVSLGLTSVGKQALKNTDKAKVVATGTLNFGSDASAKRTLK
jgi:hypothetical protein